MADSGGQGMSKGVLRNSNESRGAPSRSQSSELTSGDVSGGSTRCVGEKVLMK